MKDPGKRLGQTIAAAIIFLIVYAAVMLNFEQRHNTDLIMADSVNKTESLRGMIEGYGKTADEIGKGFCEKENARVRLEAIGLAPLVVNGEFTGDRFGENGMVVRAHKGKRDLPPEAEGLFPGLTVEMVTSEYVQNRTEASGEAATPVLLTSGPISGEWYYVRWTPAPEYDAYIRSCLPVERLTDTVQSIHDIEMFIVPSEGSPEEDRDRILYKTKGFGKYSALNELGLSEDDLDRESFTLLTDGKEYVCFPVEAENTGYTFICCNSVENEKMAILGDIIWQVLFAAIMLSGLITWCYSVRWFVRMESLDEKQRRRYSPEVVRRRTNRLTFVGTLVVTLFSFTTVIVQFMYHENRIGSNVLALLETRIEDVGEIDSSTGTLATERFADLGQTVSAMLTRDPALFKKDSLAGISDAISAKYLILYDEKGQEIACSRDYTGFSLPTDKSDAFSDFRRLLKGETVFKLLHSFINYAMFIGAVCVSLKFLGVDTTTLLASIGILSLAISLGAKDIVSDILAGLSIVFERLYLVGDVVRIGDFKGTVVEIGVRSTKVVNDAKDVKIISNHEIGNVINYSKLTSVCRVMITLPATVSIDDLEKQFEKELPLVAGTNPYIVRGPEFDGIQEFTGSSMVISVSAEGPEEHIDEIRCDLNRALQAMADKWSR